MKTFKIFVLMLISTSLLLTGCGMTSGLSGTTVGSSSSSSTSTSTSTSDNNFVFDVINSLIGNYSSLKEADLYAKWNYTGTDCRFKSENLLKKAGGELVAKEIESKLDETFTKVGIVPGACSFTFNSDKTFSATIGSKSISGTYIFDETTKTIKLSYLMGLANLDASVTKSGSTLSLLFEADKILSLLNIVGSISNSTAIKTVGSLASQYDGLLLGMQLKK